jgi:hypothetical protein
MPEMALSIETMRDSSLALLRAMEAFRRESPGDLMTAVEAYADIATSLNDRLRAAHVLLRQGRTAESLHACEAEPNVLECVAELDAVDRAIDAWRPTLEELGIRCPERLQADAAADLNAAYDVNHQLAHLMKTHRLLAIARGSLEDRVATLRAIAHLNPENPVWLEDLAEYEHECKAELEAELTRLARTDAAEVTEAVVARARRIVKELADPVWQEPLPVQRVPQTPKNALSRLRADLALQELESLTGMLAAAHAEGDVEQAESLCERWEKCARRARLGADSPLGLQARACLDWVHATVLERNAAAELRAAIDVVSRACSMPATSVPWRARPMREHLRVCPS